MDVTFAISHFKVYQSLTSDANEKQDVLQQWAQQLDAYEKKVDALNTWIDGRMGTLDSIGGVSAKWEIEMELQKFKVYDCLISKDFDNNNMITML